MYQVVDVRDLIRQEAQRWFREPPTASLCRRQRVGGEMLSADERATRTDTWSDLVVAVQFRHHHRDIPVENRAQGEALVQELSAISKETAEAAQKIAREKASRAAAAEQAAQEAERASKNAARAAHEAAQAAITAAEKAADEEIVARCVTVEATPKGGKRYTIENFEFSGCQVHRDESTRKFGNRSRVFLVLPLEDGWSVRWENLRDGQHMCWSVATQSGTTDTYPTEEERDTAPASASLTHSPFASLGKR
jgi:hypothetical protein